MVVVAPADADGNACTGGEGEDLLKAARGKWVGLVAGVDTAPGMRDTGRRRGVGAGMGVVVAAAAGTATMFPPERRRRRICVNAELLLWAPLPVPGVMEGVKFAGSE